MEISYWKSRWRKNKTGWHQSQIYSHLISYWRNLKLDKGSTVLVPLCGKSVDMLWLAEQGYRVTGIEVSEIAVESFMQESGQLFTKPSREPFTVFTSDTIQLWVGDFFKLRPQYLPTVDAIYDKAALVALPPDKRKQYARQLKELCSSHTQIFLSTLEYDQTEMTGPPFSVALTELQDLYGDTFHIQSLHEESVPEFMHKFRQRGLSSRLIEHVYLLQPGHMER